MEDRINEFKGMLKVLHKTIAADNVAYQNIVDQKESAASAEELTSLTILEYTNEVCMYANLALADVGACVLALLTADGKSHVYESKFYTKHIYASISESYKLLYGFDNSRKKSPWYRLGLVINAPSHSAWLAKHQEVTSRMDAFGVAHVNDTYRNLTMHYDADMMKVFDQMESIVDYAESLNVVIEYTKLIKEITGLTHEIRRAVEESLGVDNNSVATVKIGISDEVHAEVAKYLDMEGGLYQKLDDSIKICCEQIDFAYGHLHRMKTLQNEMRSAMPNLEPFGIPNIELPEIGFPADLMNTHLMIYTMFADLAVILRSYLRASSMIERTLLLRRLHSCSVNMLQHLYGYVEVQKEVSAWKVVHQNAMAHLEDSEALCAGIISNFENLVTTQFDTASRQLYSHYYEGKKRSISEFLDAMANMNPLIEAKKAQLFGDTLMEWIDLELKLSTKLADQTQVEKAENRRKIQEMVLNFRTYKDKEGLTPEAKVILKKINDLFNEDFLKNIGIDKDNE